MVEQLELNLEDEAAALNAAWEQVLGELRPHVKAATFEAVLKGLRALSQAGDVLRIAAPHMLMKQMVERSHLPALAEAATVVFGRPLRIEVVVDKNAASRPAPASQGKTEETPPPPTDNLVTGSLPLNARYVFDEFVIGSSNRLAYAGAMAVAESPGGDYNPLFLYGGVGLGKTHLMQAIGHELRRTHPGKKVLYLSGESFTVQYVTALQQRRMEEFRRRTRGADVLLIDDIQFIADKESTEEEFFHTFNSLYQTDRQIVIASDRSPRDLHTSSDRMRSRFESGLMADIKGPDLETRMAILQKKALAESAAIPTDVLVYMAELIHSNIRVLEGALIKLLAYASISNQPITREMADQVLGHYFRQSSDAGPVDAETIIRKVGDYYGVQVAQIKGKRRDKALVTARQVAMHLVREMTSASLPEIGRVFGGKDHTTVIHACTKIKAGLKEDPQLGLAVRELMESFQQEE
ncbi:MAG: chromosomal replication initiator protein DnaA [Armatimonadetes bacterium]|nr:chromosomal replication initiator protein DnaA [Armatimonadota bacterium]